MADMEKVLPIIIKDNETGDVKYTLEFNRASVAFAENRGFRIDEIASFPLTGIQNLFYYSFRMHHKGVTKDTTDELLASFGGTNNEELIKRLFQLYNAGINSMVDGTAKNAKFSLEM